MYRYAETGPARAPVRSIAPTLLEPSLPTFFGLQVGPPPPPPPPPPMALLEFRRSGLPSTAAIEGSAQQRARLPDVLYSVDAGRREQTPAPAPPRSSHMISRGGAQVAAAVQPMATMSISALDRLLTYAPSRMHSG